MIEMITGVPGSGKTSYAITRLYKTFGKKEDIKKKIGNEFKISDVNKAFTNINELKEEYFDNVNSLHFDDLITKLTVLHQHYKKDKWTDKQLNELATEYGISNSMYILDECHNYLDSPNTVLIWWLSYHRHLHQHIILLTQNLSLVNTKYKAFPEKFYKAVPATLKIFDSHNIYKIYTNSRLSKNSEAGKLKVKKMSEIFETYGSGANHKSKSFILPLLLLGGFLLIVFIFGLPFLFSNSNSTNELKEKQKEIKKTDIFVPEIKKEKIKSDVIANRELIHFYCSNNECYYKDISIDLNILQKFNDLDSVILFENKITNSITKYTVLISTDFLSLFEIQRKTKIIGVKNEDGTENSNYFNIID